MFAYQIIGLVMSKFLSAATGVIFIAEEVPVSLSQHFLLVSVQSIWTSVLGFHISFRMYM